MIVRCCPAVEKLWFLFKYLKKRPWDKNIMMLINEWIKVFSKKFLVHFIVSENFMFYFILVANAVSINV